MQYVRFIFAELHNMLLCMQELMYKSQGSQGGEMSLPPSLYWAKEMLILMTLLRFIEIHIYKSTVPIAKNIQITTSLTSWEISTAAQLYVCQLYELAVAIIVHISAFFVNFHLFHS